MKHPMLNLCTYRNASGSKGLKNSSRTIGLLIESNEHIYATIKNK
jgi:hypothetical protein